MNFEFNEEQKIIQKSVRDFCKAKITPKLKEIDEKGIPDDIIKGLAELGFLYMAVSNEYGGVGADPITIGIVAEEIARADITCSIPTFFLVGTVWGHILEKYAVKELKESILNKSAKGDAFVGIAATEPNTGSDLANIRTIAIKADDKYIINGEKMFISGISEIMKLPSGGGYVTLVKTEPEKKARGISAFYIPIKNIKGITTTTLDDWGRRGISTGGFALDGVEIPKSHLLGEENKGFHIAMEGFNYARAIISIVCCGVAMSALEYVMEYLKLRTAFGQPIGKFEGIQFKLSEHWAKLDAARLLGYKALWHHKKVQTEKTYDKFELTRLCAEAKILAPLFAFEAINDAIQWFGAYGYTTDCPLHLAMKGVRSYFWAEGSLEIMKIIVARELLGKDYIAYR